MEFTNYKLEVMQTRIVAIVGRPNVGKSALFNRLAGRKISIVHDQPGVTRDRLSTECRLGKEPFTILDTGGIGNDADADFSEQVQIEADIAMADSAVILFVVDGQEGLTPLDQELARKLRKSGKPLLLVVNKIDNEKHSNYISDFGRLGFERPIAISAEHNLNIGTLVENIEGRLPAADENSANCDHLALKIAIVGRPNVGKSSLINAIMNDRRTMVSEISGTTRDAVDIPYSRGEKPYIIIDTAGIRPRGKVSNSVEVFSVMRSKKSIERADLCALIIDATAGVTAQDKKIGGLIQEARKPCIIVVNKWDLMKDESEKEEFLKEVRAEFFFLNYAPFVLLSAKTGEQISRFFRMVEKVRAAADGRISTGVLNRLLAELLTANPPPMHKGRRFKIIYATQPDPIPNVAISNPAFVFFVNNKTLLVPHYRKYLESRLREQSPYDGLPIVFRFREREKRAQNKRDRR